ncbi:MAG: hypothetical protein JXR44_08160 [Thiotrichales bacterium]|nr:hypothetical protein [Thiotrichales bacterium]
MSVLLEALKKAAEEKKRLADLAETEGSKQLLNQSEEEVGASSLKPEHQVPVEVSAEDSTIPHLDLIKSESVKPTRLQFLEVPSKSLTQTSRDLTDWEDDSLASVVSPAAKCLAGKSETSEMPEMLEVRKASSEPSKVSFTLLETDKDADKGASAALSVFSVNKVLSENETESAVKAPYPPTLEQALPAAESLKSQQQKSAEQSYQWSLEQLPAYQSVVEADSSPKNSVPTPHSMPLQQNRVLTQNAHSQPYHRQSVVRQPKFVFALSAFTAFCVIGIYSAYYFDQQHKALEASFVQYKIDPIQVTLPNGSKALAASDTAPLIESGDEPSVSQGEPLQTEPEQVNKVVEAVSELKPSTALASTQTDSLQSQPSARAAMKPAIAETSKIGEAPVSDQTAAKSLKSTEQMLVLNTGNSTVIQPKPALIQRSVALSDSQKRLVKAYQAYQAGDWQTAKIGFSEVLQQEPNEIKALLGLAASHNALQEEPQAIELYLNILEREPGNAFALEALSEIVSARDGTSADWLSQLTQLAQKNPRSAGLQNTLGNAQAKQQQWFKAQQHYFNAVTLAPEHPVYLMNLAVSLDHLNKHKQAEAYYKQALIYATAATPIDQAAIKQRLISLQQLHQDVGG